MKCIAGKTADDVNKPYVATVLFLFPFRHIYENYMTSMSPLLFQSMNNVGR